MKNRILLIDDDEEFLELMTTYIEMNSNFEVIPSKWPEMADQMIAQYQPKVVVTDTNMPNLNGIELLKKVKIEFPGLPVVILFSGLKGSQIVDADVLQMGADAVLPKTKAIRELLSLLSNLVSNRV